MSLMRRLLFSSNCPNCSQRLDKGANFCRHCGWGNSTSWRRCFDTKCGANIAADSAFCWKCGKDQRQWHGEPSPVVSDTWRREPGMFAYRVGIEAPRERLRNGIQVEEGTRGVFLHNGRIAREANGQARELFPGFELVSTFLDRLLGTSPMGTLEAVIANSEPVDVRIEAGPASPILTMNSQAVEAAVILQLQLGDFAAFVRTFMPTGTEMVRDEDLGTPITARVVEVLQRAALRRTAQDIITDVNLRPAVEAELGSELPHLLEPMGLIYRGVQAIRFTGDIIDRTRDISGHIATTQQETEWAKKLREIEMSGELSRIGDEHEFQDKVDQISHVYGLNKLERDQLMKLRVLDLNHVVKINAATKDAEFRLKQQAFDNEERRRREAHQRELEAIEAQHRREQERLRIEADLASKEKIARQKMTLERDEDMQDLETLRVLREHQLATLARMKEIKREDHRAVSDINATYLERIAKLPLETRVGALNPEQARQAIEALRAVHPSEKVMYVQTPPPPAWASHRWTPEPAAAAPVSPPPSGGDFEGFGESHIGSVGVVYIGDPGLYGAPLATAWVVKGKGVLATNAHVAVVIAEKGFQAGLPVWVLLSGHNQAPLQINSVDIHPGYPGLLRDSNAVPAYDVALLHAAQPVPSSLGLNLAPREKLHRLRQFSPVASLGFPLKDMGGGGVNTSAPQAVAYTGTLSGITNWERANQPDPKQNLLLAHTIPCAEGSSGSPVFDKSGDVIGMLSAVSKAQVLSADGNKDTIPLSNFGFAQRIDVLMDWKGW